MKTKKDLKVGDKIYIAKSGWMHRGEPKLTEHTIKKINTSSLYYKSGDNLIRISLRDMKGKLATTHFTAYINKEDFYGPIRESEEKRKYIKEIEELISQTDFSIKDLKEIKDFLVEKQN